MTFGIPDHGLDTLLDLDGQKLAVDEEGRYWVEFMAAKVAPSPHQPHGLNYALVLFDRRTGERLVCFDNAHAVAPTTGPSGRRRRKHDHKHRLRTIQPYDYQDAATLVSDFWTTVDSVLKEKGVYP
ncbi:MAG: hypothetical protein HOF11_18630 [Rhodospirillaceae bacterium]|jgi:hypothetical protein|nr:hypothetical protein [Rhodospirillaceae bacterium]